VNSIYYYYIHILADDRAF